MAVAGKQTLENGSEFNPELPGFERPAPPGLCGGCYVSDRSSFGAALHRPPRTVLAPLRGYAASAFASIFDRLSSVRSRTNDFGMGGTGGEPGGIAGIHHKRRMFEDEFPVIG